MINISVYLTMFSIYAIPASSHCWRIESVWCCFSVGSASALALLGLLLTCRAYKTKFTVGGKLWVRYDFDKARADL